MTALLAELDHIKQLRENNALIEVRKRRYRVEDCARAKDQKATELADYRQWRPAREDELFADIRRQPVALKAVDDYKAALGLLRERENGLADQLNQAEQALTTAKSELTAAEADHAAALRAKEKFAELLAIQRRELQRLRDYREDLELEEFSGKPALTSTTESSDGDGDR
ncbi:MAG: type III secretion protein [Candidatus Competibacter sp.]